MFCFHENRCVWTRESVTCKANKDHIQTTAYFKAPSKPSTPVKGWVHLQVVILG